MTTNDQPARPLDLLTVFAIAIIAYIIANVLHEVVGHAGVCVMVGCTPSIVSTAHVDYSSVGSDVGMRLVSSGGTLINLIAALIFWLLLRRSQRASGSLRYFLWFTMVVNLLVGTGYFLFSGVIGIGDWNSVVEGWEPAGLWRIVLSVIGLVAYVGAIVFSLRTLAPLVGSDKRLALKLTTFAYLVGGVASTLGAFLNPEGMVLVAISAAAHFGGTSGLAWMAQMLGTPWFPVSQGTPITIPRSWAWIGAAAVLLLFHIVVLGPGIRF
jgi:hypothetical protein